MGATQSITKTPLDVANEVVSNITTHVLTENKTQASGIQSINIGCTDAAIIAQKEACSADTIHRDAMIAKIAEVAPTVALAMIGKTPEEIKALQPASCHMCDAENIDQDMNISISVDAINDNKIAQGIQAQLMSKLDNMAQNKTEGGIGLTQSQMEAAATLKNHVENNFNTNIVNKTLNTFQFKQDLTATNVKLKNINQKLVGTAVASAIVRNAMENNSEVKSAIDAVSAPAAATKGTDPLSFFSGIGAMIAMIMVPIALIFIAFLIYFLKPATTHTVAALPAVPAVALPSAAQGFVQPAPQSLTTPYVPPTQGFTQQSSQLFNSAIDAKNQAMSQIGQLGTSFNPSTMMGMFKR